MDAPPLELRPARFSDRFLAYLLDTLPFGLAALGAAALLCGPLGRAPRPELLARIAAAALTAAVFLQFAGAAAGATPGKALLGLRVAGPDGGPPGVWRALVRALAWLAGTPLNAGFLLALLRSDSRALHDLVSGTRVVESGAPRRAGLGAFLAAALGAAGLAGANAWMARSLPTPSDRAAVARAREGLAVLARVEEAVKESAGSYTASFDALAQASGDPGLFRGSMGELFAPGSFEARAGNRGYVLRARARDRAGTIVELAGPRPARGAR